MHTSEATPVHLNMTSGFCKNWKLLFYFFLPPGFILKPVEAVAKCTVSAGFRMPLDLTRPQLGGGPAQHLQMLDFVGVGQDNVGQHPCCLPNSACS